MVEGPIGLPPVGSPLHPVARFELVWWQNGYATCYCNPVDVGSIPAHTSNKLNISGGFDRPLFVQHTLPRFDSPVKMKLT